MANTIYVFKLISGEEVVAELVGHYGEIWEFKKPRVLQLVSNNTGGFGAAFVPYCMTMQDSNLSFYLHSLVFRPVTADSKLEKAYLSNVSSLILNEGIQSV